jgi:NAD+ kinase
VSSPSTATEQRRVLVIAHTGRRDASLVAVEFCRRLHAAGLSLRLLAEEAAQLSLDLPDVEVVQPRADAAADCEVVIVIGGDGTILRAAELARECGSPLLGVNLGHVGFLAEAEPDDVESTVDAIVHRRYTAEERMTLDVLAYRDADAGNGSGGDSDGGEDLKQLVCRTWALNEASVEKAARERMLEVVVEVDGRPLSRWGCDGVVCATPTGSTAYNFSAGGPVVWPGVEALLMVPISAHALFARPLVVAPTSVLAVEVLARTAGAGVLWCDGRRTVDLPPGARIEVRRGGTPVRLVRLHQAPFTDRLVAKFDLPVTGWRGAAERRRRNGGGRQGHGA